MSSASSWIETLGLAEHPEGGYYRETYRSTATIDTAHGLRSCSTAIYYLLRSGEVSRLHRLRSDELFHFHDGTTLSIHVIDPDGGHAVTSLGPAAQHGEQPQAVVPAGCWFGATVEAPDSFALVGCTVSPGFDFDDFELAERTFLARRYPQHRAIIERLTPGPPGGRRDTIAPD